MKILIWKKILASSQINNQNPGNKSKNNTNNNQKIHNSTFLSNKNIDKNDNDSRQNWTPGNSRSQIHYLSPLIKYNEKIIKNPVQETATNPGFTTSRKTPPVANGTIIPAANQVTPRLVQNSASNLRCSLDSFFIKNDYNIVNGKCVKLCKSLWI